MSKRRQHPLEFKRQLVAESSRRGASIAGIALAHGINANQLHKWRRELLPSTAPAPSASLLPVTLEPSLLTAEVAARDSCPGIGTIEIELPHARLALRGQVDLDALQTILAVLRPR